MFSSQRACHSERAVLQDHPSQRELALKGSHLSMTKFPSYEAQQDLESIPRSSSQLIDALESCSCRCQRLIIITSHPACLSLCLNKQNPFCPSESQMPQVAPGRISPIGVRKVFIRTNFTLTFRRINNTPFKYTLVHL